MFHPFLVCGSQGGVKQAGEEDNELIIESVSTVFVEQQLAMQGLVINFQMSYRVNILSVFFLLQEFNVLFIKLNKFIPLNVKEKQKT